MSYWDFLQTYEKAYRNVNISDIDFSKPPNRKHQENAKYLYAKEFYDRDELLRKHGFNVSEIKKNVPYVEQVLERDEYVHALKEKGINIKSDKEMRSAIMKNLFKDITEEDTYAPWYTRFVLGMASGVYSEIGKAIDNPLVELPKQAAIFAAGAGIATGSRLLGLGALGMITGNALVVGGVNTFDTTESNEVRKLIGEEKESLKKSFVDGTLTGLFIGGVSHAGVASFKKLRNIMKNKTHNQKYDLLKNIHIEGKEEKSITLQPQDFQEIVDADLTSALTPHDASEAKSDMKIFIDSIKKQDTDKALEVLVKDRSKNFYINNDIIDALNQNLKLPENDTDIVKSNKKTYNELKNIANEYGIESAERGFEDQIIGDISRAGNALNRGDRDAGDIGISEKPVIDKNKLIEDLFSRTCPNIKEYMPEKFSIMVKNTSKNSELKLNFSAAKFTESVLETPIVSKTGIFNGIDTLARLRNIFNATIENAEMTIGKHISELFDGIVESNMSQTDLLNEISSRNYMGKYFSNIENLFLEKFGITLPKPENTLHNIWSNKKVLKVAKEDFINDLITNINIDRMLEISEKREKPINDVRNFLSDVYDNISVNKTKLIEIRDLDGRFKLIGLNTKQILHAINGDSWLFLNDKYGKFDNYIDVLKHVTSSHSKQFVRATIGIHDFSEIEDFTKQLMQGLKTKAITLKNKENFKLREDFNEKMSNIEQRLINALEGNVNSFIPNAFIVNTTRLGNLMKKSMLSNAWMTAFMIDYFGGLSFLNQTLGNSVMKNIINKDVIKTMNSLSKKELRNLVNIFTANQRMMIDEVKHSMISSTTKRTMHKAINFPLKMLDFVTDKIEKTATLTFQRTLFENKDLSIKKIPNELKTYLDIYNIKAKDWDTYRKLPAYMINNETGVFAVEYIRKKGFSNTSIDKFALAEVGAKLLGSPKTTTYSTSGITKAGDSSVSQLTVSGTRLFVDIISSTYDIYSQFFSEEAKNNNYHKVSQKALTLLLPAMALVAVRNASKGKKTDVTSFDFLARSIAYSGLTTELGEMIVEAILADAFDNQFMYKDLLKNAKQAAKLKYPGRKFVRSFDPYANVPMLGLITQRYLINNLFSILDPKGAKAYDKYIDNRLRKGHESNVSAFFKKSPGVENNKRR